MQVFYNDVDQNACAWLRALIAGGHLPAGRVDDRSICELPATDLVGYDRVGLFAGIGGWEEACRLAGWPAHVPLWHGSCPCPPFSAAGKKQRCPQCGGRPVPCPRRTGFFICLQCEHAWHADARHLWPEFWRLVAQCRPPVVVGEQVSGPDGLLWLAGVRASLEILGYRVGAADLAAGGVGAPHIRQRLFWVAVRNDFRPTGVGHEANPGGEPGERGAGGFPAQEAGEHRARPLDGRVPDRPADGRQAGRLPDAEPARRQGGVAPELPGAGRRGQGEEPVEPRPVATGGVGESAVHGDRHLPISGSDCAGEGEGWECQPGGSGPSGGVAYAALPTGERQPAQQHVVPGAAGRANGVVADADGRESRRREHGLLAAGRGTGFWDAYAVLPFRDGKSRRIEPGTFPLADGVPARVVKLRGYGNAIVPQIAAVFLQAVLDILGVPPAEIPLAKPSRSD